MVKSTKLRSDISPEEFLVEGTRLEESGEKWRAGDAVKSSNFIRRALDNYNLGLSQFPADFDLAYNKARLQYQRTQYPPILAQFHEPLIELLQEALASHKFALSIDPANADLLYNTAQVLSSLAEALDDGTDSNTPRNLLEDAVGMLSRSLAEQEQALARASQESADASYRAASEQSDDTVTPPECHATAPVANTITKDEERWASVQEPISEKTICDTLIAVLETLASICDYIPSNALPDVEAVRRMGEDVIANKAPMFLEKLDEDEQLETGYYLATAKYVVAVSELAFKSGLLDLKTYDASVKSAFEQAQHTHKKSRCPTPEILCSYADSIIDFVIATSEAADAALVRWNRATKASELLTLVSQMSSAKDLCSVYVGRADIELLRYRLCFTEGQELASCTCSSKLTVFNLDLPANLRTDKSRKTLLENSHKYYRGAVSFTEARPNETDAEGKKMAVVKEAVVACLINRNEEALEKLYAKGFDRKYARRVISDMVDQKLVSEGVLS
ncbi:MAG: hypothetical protein M1828_006794 [Chrysothrix sp. TS-e1954]|nr:MAG: hypothetical protein M1828_006794 [Chrysothrix sp. TS-e1954]